MSLDTLIQALEAGDAPSSRDLTALSSIDPAARERFAERWRALSYERRRSIIDQIVLLAEDNVESNFTEIFKLGLSDSDAHVRIESIKGLWEYEGYELIGCFRGLIGDPEASVRAEAAIGLGRILLRAELDDRDDPAIRTVEDDLRALHEDAAQPAEIRGRALEALGVRPHAWVAGLIGEAFSSGDRLMQLSALHAMGRSADTTWLSTVLGEMESEDGEMRFEAATAAGIIAGEEAVEPLARLASDDDTEVRDAAIDALGQIGGPAARSALHALAADTNDELVLEAVSNALAQADFVEDPLGIRLHIERSVADDYGDEDENL